MGLLREHGVYDENRPLRAPYDSWESLKNQLDNAKRDHPDRLCALCSKILRQKDKYLSLAHDPTAFSDSLAQFVIQLELDGFRFNEFEIVSMAAAPLKPQLADEALEVLLKSVSTDPQGAKVSEHLPKAWKQLDTGDWSGCLTNLRLALKYTLEGIARVMAERKGESLPSDKENEVRDYLKRIGFLSEEEWRGFWGIYGLLSAGPHGDPGREAALFGYAACVMACQYAIDKLKKTSS